MSHIKEQLRDWLKGRNELDKAIGGEAPHEKTLLIAEAINHIERQEAHIAELHTSIAGAVQHGEQGWQRYESANKMCINQQAEIAGLNQVIAELRKVVSDCKTAMNDYYYALDTRQNGNVAQNRSFDNIESALGMTWIRGETLAKYNADTSTQEVGYEQLESEHLGNSENGTGIYHPDNRPAKEIE